MTCPIQRALILQDYSYTQTDEICKLKMGDYNISGDVTFEAEGYRRRSTCPQMTTRYDLMASTPVVRVPVFISSPGDVLTERAVVQQAIEELNRLPPYHDRYDLYPLLYEGEVPPVISGDSTRNAQQVVNYYMGSPQDSYLLICIMWNRMGTPFTDAQTGQVYRSGTEYELTVARQAHQQNGLPHILLFRKTTPDPRADQRQKWMVDEFFKHLQTPSAQFFGLYKSFAAAKQLRVYVQRHIAQILKNHPPGQGTVNAAGSVTASFSVGGSVENSVIYNGVVNSTINNMNKGEEA
jgi:hypothetical protein